MKYLVFCVSLIVTALHVRSAISNIDEQDLAALHALQKIWSPTSFSWYGDPCESRWLGVTCDSNNANVIKLALPAQSILGRLPSEIGGLLHLQSLDLSYNGNLTGTLPPELFQLTNLQELFLQSCGLSGAIPDDLGKLVKLTYLALNQNFFTGTIPTTIGQLSDLLWFDLSYNQFSGNLPLELSNLTKAQHFHLQANKFSGIIPAGIFNASQPLVHLLLQNNSFEGPIPSDIGSLPILDILRLDFNEFSTVPESLNKLVTVTSLQLDHNSFTGHVVNVSSLLHLQYLYLGNNQFTPGALPSWMQSLQNLTSLDFENGGLQGPLPASLFALPNLENVNVGYNHLNGTLDLSQASSSLVEVDAQQNNFTGLAGSFSGILNFQGNDICYTNTNLASTVCGSEVSVPKVAFEPSSSCDCSSGLASNPTADTGSCLCSYPISGLLVFTALKIPLGVDAISELQSGYVNSIPLISSTTQVFIVAFSSSTATLSIYPDKTQFWDANDANTITSLISVKAILFPTVGPYIFIPSGPYLPLVPTKSGLSAAEKAGVGVGAAVFSLVVILVALYAIRQKKRAEKAELISKPFVSWLPKQEDKASAPKLKGARFFTLEEMKKVTNNFSQAQEIGAGGYGKVYKATLPSGEQVAIKRSQASSQQGAAEFKNEIELLSRLHHKNLVELIGFCFEEQMLIYEYLPNGTLRDALSGRTNVQMNWPRRLQAALDSARGLAYLHNEANPTIIHRDIKSANILLDEKLMAKVADFGLSKLAPDENEDTGHDSTQVKGTLGYMDPEYYTSRRLSDKSDVYSFGIVLLELITSREPSEHGRFIVREVKPVLQRGGLAAVRESLLDLNIEESCPDSQLKPLLDLALRCVEGSADLRPSMKQVTKELEAIIEQSEGNDDIKAGEYVSRYKKGQESQVLLYDSSAFQYSGAYDMSKAIKGQESQVLLYDSSVFQYSGAYDMSKAIKPK